MNYYISIIQLINFLNLVLENKILPSKTCSVCFKLRITFFNEKIIKLICQKEGNGEIDIEFLKCKNEFYQWLYQKI
jgi:hypothetical protein